MVNVNVTCTSYFPSCYTYMRLSVVLHIPHIVRRVTHISDCLSTTRPQEIVYMTLCDYDVTFVALRERQIAACFLDDEFFSDC